MDVLGCFLALAKQVDRGIVSLPKELGGEGKVCPGLEGHPGHLVQSHYKDKREPPYRVGEFSS